MFHDDDMIRIVDNEGVLLLGGGRALLLQIAHPLVAAGVAEHSAFRQHGLDRLVRTLRGTYAIVFGTPEGSRLAAERLRAVHERVRGAGYAANDPALLLWVHATLVDTSLLIYTRFLRPLTAGERERFYADSMRMGEAMGIPRNALPPDYRAFRQYMRSVVTTLRVSDTGRALAEAIFRPAPGIAPFQLAARELTAGLLPATLREQFGLPWGARRALALALLARASRTVLPRVPRRIRAVPPLLMPPPTHPERSKGDSLARSPRTPGEVALAAASAVQRHAGSRIVGTPPHPGRRHVPRI